MSKVKISAAKVAFDELWQSTQDWLSWVSGAQSFKVVMSQKIPWDNLSKGEREAVGRQLKEQQPNSQLLINSLYITLAAGFEDYLRGCLREVTTEINKSKKPTSQISPEILKLTMRETAKLLRRVDSPPDYINYNADELCKNIGSCSINSAAFLISEEAMAEIESPLKVENFLDRLNSLKEKKYDWDWLASSNEIKIALNLEGQGERTVAKQLKIEITKIVKYRNRIAHTGGTAADVTEQVLREHGELLNRVAEKTNSAVI